MELEKVEGNKIERDELGRILPGQESLNPNGRPKGKSMKEFAREYYMLKSDDEKRAYIEWLDEKKPGFAWTMGEGNPENKVDIPEDSALSALLVKFIDAGKDS